jgi:hypothetical protein
MLTLAYQGTVSDVSRLVTRPRLSWKASLSEMKTLRGEDWDRRFDPLLHNPWIGTA